MGSHIPSSALALNNEIDKTIAKKIYLRARLSFVMPGRRKPLQSFHLIVYICVLNLASIDGHI